MSPPLSAKHYEEPAVPSHVGLLHRDPRGHLGSKPAALPAGDLCSLPPGSLAGSRPLQAHIGFLVVTSLLWMPGPGLSGDA